MRANMLRLLRRNYLSIDPRTLGLVRIALGLLLLVDLAKRSRVLTLFYTNRGLLPNHRLLWRPTREFTPSFLFALSYRHEVVLAFVLIGLVYVGFLIGYRTRLMHGLSWVCLVSLQVRADILSNGADFVFSDVVLWTAFLPMGRRFSLDALLQSLRDGAEPDFAALRHRVLTPRDTRPVVSLAVLAATLQLSVIYAFNTLHKHGETWRDGSAVYWLVHQERIVTHLGLFAREHWPLWAFQGLAYGTLLVEGALPLLMLSPWGRPWTRRLAIGAVFGLHGGMAMLSNLGLFSPVMMAFSLLLLDARDWDALPRATRPRLRLYVEESTGLCWQAARLWARLDVRERLDLQPWAAFPATATALPPHGGYVVVDGAGRAYVLEPALRRLLGTLPLGSVWVAVAQLSRPLTAPLLRWVGRNRLSLSRQFGLSPAAASRAPTAVAESDAPFWRGLRALQQACVELSVAALLVVASSQVLNENPAVPGALKHRQPWAIRAGVDYFRLNQGWSMFAPDAPTRDLWIVVDAVTHAGRHVDPFNEVASRIADPSLRSIPKRLGQAAAYCDYTVRIPGDDIHHEALRDWIMAYHDRTHRPEDRVEHFKAYVIEQDSPRPGEAEPRNVTAQVFLRH
jgi:hypothetical protein